MRQGDLIFHKLFAATIQEVFKSAQLEEKGIFNIDGEKLSDLRIADDIALATEGVRNNYGTSVKQCKWGKLKNWSQDT